MSDEEVQTKRGRKAAAESTKRTIKPSKAEVKEDAEAPPAKRGRGRPKGGATKKKPETKAKANGVGRRGRSKKEEKEESAEEENGAKSSENEDDD